MSSTDDILALLDQVDERMIRCPICGKGDDLYSVYIEGYSVTALPSVTGDLLTYGDSECVDVPNTICPARWVTCGNVLHHPDKLWHWFPLPADVSTRDWYQTDPLDGSWETWMQARADAS